MSRTTPRRSKAGINNKKQALDYITEEPFAYFRKNYKNDNTRNAYIKHFKRFAKWAQIKYKCKNPEQCRTHIQDYVDWLVRQGKTASTIHTYIAPVCGYYKINMSEIKKPIRYTCDITRGRSRDSKYDRTDQQYDNGKYKYVAEFQSMVGIRRAELMRLTNDCFVKDESGYNCIYVRRGKGGKLQLQRILPDDVEKVKAYFTTPGTGKLFTQDQFSGHMDYHRLRALQAQRAYRYYYSITHTDDPVANKQAVERLTKEIIARWNKYNLNQNGKSRYLDIEKKLRGTYKLRRTNRDFAVKNKLPTEYDRLAVMCVSIFHLSHWRLDTLCNYLLVV